MAGGEGRRRKHNRFTNNCNVERDELIKYFFPLATISDRTCNAHVRMAGCKHA